MNDSHLPADAEWTSLQLLQADMDDESPEVLGAVREKALELGALDAVSVSIQMKKDRPGTRLEILARPEDSERLATLLLRETSTLGVRRLPIERVALARREEVLSVAGERIRVKLALWNGKPFKAKPEFEDCRRAAVTSGHPLRDVLEAARREAARFLDHLK